jgi:hypothetical protein
MRPRHFWLFCAAVLLSACAGDPGGTPDSATTPPIGTLPSSATAGPGTTEAVTSTTTPAEVYVLQAGDTPSQVARQFGLTVAELDAYNSGVSGYRRFVVGAVVWVTPPPTAVPTEPAAAFLPTPGLVAMTFTGTVAADDGVRSDARDGDGASDFWPLLARVASITAAADLTICHLADAEVPDELTSAMAFAGFDRCSHPAGPPVAIGATVPDTREIEVNGVRVAHLAYAGDVAAEEVVADATAEREAGAEVVVVAIDWGEVRSLTPTETETALVEGITASGAADLVVGQAPMLRGVEQVNGVWVAWGLGGFLSSGPASSGWPPAVEDSATLTIRFARGLDGRLSVGDPVLHATWCDRSHDHVVHPVGDLGDAALAPEVRVALQRSDTRSRATLGPLLAG